MQNLFSDAPEITKKPFILSRNDRGIVKFMIYIRNGEAGSHLLLNRFGHSDMLGLSTRRDLFISAIISDIFFAERVVKVPNVERNIAFFGSRRSEQPSNIDRQ